MSTVMPELPRRHRITVEHFYRMGDAGVFEPNERVELVNGEIIDVPPMGSRHAASVDRMMRALTAAVGARAFVRSQLPVRLNEDSEPLPDFAVVRPRDDDYAESHPAARDVLLIVEVSASTLPYDRDVKTALYARSGVHEVWIVDLAASQLQVHKGLQAGAYADVQTRAFGPVAIAALADVTVDLTPLGK